MDLFSVLFIAVSLSADCFAVALSGSISMGTPSRVQVLRASFAFGLSQFLMPVLGWLAGKTIVEIIASFDHWVAFALLALVGGRMLWEALRGRENGRTGGDITRGFLLLTLAVATSIDALAVGLSFAFFETGIVKASVIIGGTAFLITAAGFLLGKRAGVVLGKRAKLAGGVILIGIGLRILLTHLL